MYDNGLRFFGASATFFYKKKLNENPRVGYIVTKKSGNSPKRNRIKRVMKVIVGFFATHGHDVVVSHKKFSEFNIVLFKNDYVKFIKKLRG